MRLVGFAVREILSERSLYWASVAAAALAGAVGVASIALWYGGGSPTLERPGLGMALGFIAGSIGTVFAAQGRQGLAALAGATVLAIAAWIFAQVSSAGIQPSGAATTAAIYSYARLAAVAALACVAAVLLLATLRRSQPWRTAVMEILSFVPFAYGAILLTRYWLQHGFADGWDTAMAKPGLGGLGFMLLGLALSAASSRPAIAQHRMPLGIPALACFLVFLIDVSVPQGVGTGILYLPLVFSALWFPRASAAFFLGAVAGILAVLGLMIRRDFNVDLAEVAASRGILLCALMFMAFLVSARRSTEELLQSSKERTQLIVQYAIDAVITIDDKGKITEWNKMAETIFGWPQAEAIGRRMEELIVPAKFRADHLAGMKRFLMDGAGPILNRRIELPALKRNGEQFPVELTVTANKLRDKHYFTAFIRDITDRRLSEENNALLAAIVKASEDAIISKTLDGTITSWNASAERLFGHHAQEAIGQSIAMIIPPDKMEEEKQIISRIRRSVPIDHFETVRVDNTGKRVDVTLSASPIYDSRGTIVGVSTIIHDITARKQSEQQIKDSANRLKAVFDTVVDGIITIDAQMNVQSFNAAAERIFGYEAAEVIGQNAKMLIPEPHHPAYDSYFRGLLRSDGDSSADIGREVTAQRKDGSTFPMELGVSEFTAGGQKAFVASVRDISQRKEAEAEVLRYTKALETSNKELDDFAYIASHDLKEPLRGLHNHARFLLEDNLDKLDEENAGRLQRVAYLSQRMEKLVNDLLYFSRLGRHDLAIQPTDIGAVVRDIEFTLEGFLEERKGRISVPQALPVVVCDKTRVTELLRNLVTNAIKYNDRTEKIVEIGFLKSRTAKDGAVHSNVFYVSDNGRGIETEFHDEIFRIFRRLQASADPAEDGTGVGLTFVRKIVERHGGKIWLESEVGTGTTFYFTLKSGRVDVKAAA